MMGQPTTTIQGSTSSSSVEARSRFAFLRDKRFWIVLLLGQILSLCNVGASTFSTLLTKRGTSIPAFQNMFNYLLLNMVYTSYTIYKYGLRKYSQLLLRDGWKYFILAFFDVEGNYFVVLAFRYTTILSAQLISFWAIVVVVILSFSFLKVRYNWAQVSGILVACGGMGLLIASDRIHNHFPLSDDNNNLKGNLFMLLGATFYGFSNVSEEFLVSKRPLYEVVGQIGFWGIYINGVQAAIFDRNQFTQSTWDGIVAGYIVGFTLCLSLFYSFVPILFRMSSAAFFNISLLTSNFWALLIGLRVFGYTIMYLYGVAFACIILGLVVYCLFGDRGENGGLGESRKPWLGENQEDGIAGFGTAKRTIVKRGGGTGSPRSPSNDATSGDLEQVRDLEAIESRS